MIKLLEDVFRAFGEILAWLLGTKKKQISKQRKNVVREPEYDVWKVKILAPRRESQHQAITSKPKSVTQKPVAKSIPQPSIEIDPNAFYYWAGHDLGRWQLMIGATVQHTFYGIGKIRNVYCKDDQTRKIYINIQMRRDNRRVVFFAAEFYRKDTPFFELLVNSACYEEFKNGQPRQSVVEQALPDQPISPSQWKYGWSNFTKIIERHKIGVLYHFTDSANLPSIVQHGGLYSWWSCQQNGIPIPRTGGNAISRELDRRKELQDYVRLSFNGNHPMLAQSKHEGRIDKPIILKINSEVIYWASTLFSNLNATATNAQIGSDMEDFKRINFDIVTQPYYSDHTKSLYQAEVLVRSHIPIKYILNIP